MDQLPKDFLDKSTEQIAMRAVELGFKLPFKMVLVDSAEYAMVINVDKSGPQIAWQSAPDVFRFPVHVMVSGRTGKPAAYAVLGVDRSKPKLRLVK